MKKIYYSIAIAVMTGISFLSAQTNPTPWNLNSSGNFSFTSFSPSASSFPSGMVFHQMGASPTTLSTAPSANVPLPCSQIQATNTNVWGLGVQGIGIRVNPSGASTGYTAGRSDEVIVAVNTTSRTKIKVSYKAGSVQAGGPQAAIFRLRCQYRVGSSGSWSDMPGGVSEYQGVNPPDSVNFGPYTLPASVENQSVVQVRWVYYYVSGSWSSTSNRTQRIQLDDISITSLPVVTQSAFASVCPNSARFTLSGGSPAGGSYSGTGVVNGNSFDPSVSGAGTFPLVYTYTDAFGNSNSATQSITVDYNSCTTQLNSAACGASNFTLDNTIYCDPLSGAQDYEWLFTNASLGFSFSHVKGNNYESLTLWSIPGLQYGQTYTVTVRAKILNTWRNWGPACTITMQPTIPLTALNATWCGATNVSLGADAYCYPVAGATKYQFEFVNASTGATITYLKNGNGWSVALWDVPGLSYKQTYNVRVKSYVGGVWSSYGGVCTLSTMNPGPITQLQASSCGITESTLDQVLLCNAVGGATQYRYELTDIATSAITTYTRSGNSNDLQLTWVPGTDYGKTYNIRVAAFAGGEWMDYGAACTVSTPATAVTQLQSAYCGITETSIVQVLYCYSVAGATKYAYEITDVASGGLYGYIRAGANDFQMSWVPNVTYGKTYSIRVAGYTTNGWLAYGPSCTVTTPAAPTTQLSAAYCNIVESSMSQTLYCDPVAGATNYRYYFIDQSNGYAYAYVRGNSTDLQMNWVTGITSGRTYSVLVSAYVGAWLPYGSACSVTIGGAARLASSEPAQADRMLLAGNQNAKIYPNPNKGTFTLETSRAADIRISNLLGVSVYSGKVVEGVHSLDLGAVEPGVYLVQVYDGNNSWLIRMVKE